MAYQGINTRTERISPTRRTPSNGPRVIEPPPVKKSDDYAFPEAYTPEKIEQPTETSSCLPLDAGVERLIELAATHIGCPHEELLDLKARALTEPENILSFCQHIFDTRIRPLREAVDPLAAFSEPGLCAMRVHGESGSVVATLPENISWAPYHKATLENYHIDRSPFADN